MLTLILIKLLVEKEHFGFDKGLPTAQQVLRITTLIKEDAQDKR